MQIDAPMFDLVRAFDEARLAALHVDMQNCFYYTALHPRQPQTDYVFPIVDEFAANLRDLGVENNWVAYTEFWRKMPYDQFQHSDGRTHGLKRHLLLDDLMDVHPDDLVFEKNDQTSFREKGCLLTDHFTQRGQDTLIIDGLKDMYCVADTIADAISDERQYKAYVPLDATNCPANEREGLIDWFMRGTAEHQRERLCFTDTDTITHTLMAAQSRQQQPLLAYG